MDEKFSKADDETVEAHKEMTESFIKRFIDDIRKIEQKLQCNPFANDKFLTLNSPFIFIERIVTNTTRMFDEGKSQ